MIITPLARQDETIFFFIQFNNDMYKYIHL